MKNELIKRKRSPAELLSNGLPLVDLLILEDLSINGGEIWNREVTILNCDVEKLNCMMVYFDKPVTFKNCRFKNAIFNFAYFQKGLLIEDCIFEKYLDFEAGGHNEIGAPIIIQNNEFKQFVNFSDCWFTGEIEVTKNKFMKGTNIASKSQYLTFDIKPTFHDNIGRLDIESECREEEH